jgi:putative aminopeptidase FrvX
MHSIVEMADFADVENVIRLMTAFVRSVKVGERFAVEI